MSRGAKLPRFSPEMIQDPVDFASRMNQFITSLESRLQGVEGLLVDPQSPSVGEEAYVVINATEKRAFDANTVTLPELADVVGTFLEDLKNEDKLR